MTVAQAPRRLATPGMVLMFAGVVMVWWGAGIFRGETGVGGEPRRLIQGPLGLVGREPAGPAGTGGGGRGNQPQ